ncbi:hypothetical protein NQ314_020657 [Rhamnusium bicolor]|uniref:PDZ domain-containing protein n=1 Tax=Rhamnusium bicolor TaxID=1586634 RepID=A0AAV8WKQ1_9CUCU|nr:hypothetical protein NQ314_020657 [Rhamnusium bicolor]
MSQIKDNFVTVVAVGSEQQEQTNIENINFESNSPGYVTVLTIGDTENNKVLRDVTEEVIVYRLPGERLGFGLKFEGGTKASEFVKRLFIQSCAADSPASRVKSSWGKLAEGDEVLEIDSIPVNTMTRIDCVRCLKDSNVAIKLLVRHIYDTCKPKTKSEDPPLIISTEEKRIPPPPPPVPPRKIPRKLLKNSSLTAAKEVQDNSQDNNIAPPRQSNELIATSKSRKLQSPRSSGRSYYSPDIPRRDRRFSDGSLGPPDAEVYVDLFLQESTQSLSESDDTGSTISTVIDRFGSFPTTTTSSFSGSLPSTPTAVQKQLDISNITIYDDEDTGTNKHLIKPLVQNKEENNNNIINTAEEGSPSLPPRSRDSIQNINYADVTKDVKFKQENSNLPRLVDFVPKSSSGVKENIENSTEIMKLFLENERYKINFTDYNTDENDNLDTYSNGIDLYSSKWSLSSQLATIGEVEEEGGSEINFNRPSVKSTPVVIVENADCNNENEKTQCQNETLNNKGSYTLYILSDFAIGNLNLQTCYECFYVNKYETQYQV